jgi:hypothetical protein
MSLVFCDEHLSRGGSLPIHLIKTLSSGSQYLRSMVERQLLLNTFNSHILLLLLLLLLLEQ